MPDPALPSPVALFTWKQSPDLRQNCFPHQNNLLGPAQGLPVLFQALEDRIVHTGSIAAATLLLGLDDVHQNLVLVAVPCDRNNLGCLINRILTKLSPVIS